MAGTCDTITDIWCVDNAIDDATLSGASATAALGPERLKDPRLGVAWRTPVGGATTLTIQIPLGAVMGVFGVFGISKPTTAFTLEMCSAVAGPADVRAGAWAPDVDPDIKQAIWLYERDGSLITPPDPDVPPTVREIRLTVADEYCDIGRIWAGPYHWTPCTGHTYGSGETWTDLSTVGRARRTGAVFADRGNQQRGHTVNYDAITPDEWEDQVYTLERTAGRSKQLLYLPNYAMYPPERHGLCGYQLSQNPIIAQGFQRFQKSYSLREAG